MMSCCNGKYDTLRMQIETREISRRAFSRVYPMNLALSSHTIIEYIYLQYTRLEKYENFFMLCRMIDVRKPIDFYLVEIFCNLILQWFKDSVERIINQTKRFVVPVNDLYVYKCGLIA